MPTLDHLRCNDHPRPLGVGTEPPRFAWRLGPDARDARWWRVLVRRADDGEVCWDSGTVADRAGAVAGEVRYAGRPLGRDAVYRWRVEVGLAEDAGPVTAEAVFETGPAPAWWYRARWVTAHRSRHEHVDYRPSPYLRRVVDLTRLSALSGRPGDEVVGARLHVTAGGLYRATVNGIPVSDDHLVPGWTDYQVRIPYRSHDVTGLLRPGRNCLGLVVGDGWYSGRVGPQGFDPDADDRNADPRVHYYGEEPAVKAVLVLRLASGEEQRVVTDTDWRASFGPIRASDLLNGELYDARHDLGRWDLPDYDDSGWSPATVLEDDTPSFSPTASATPGASGMALRPGPQGSLEPARHRAVRPVAEYPVVAELPTLPGSRLLDLGQNFAGHVRLTLPSAPAGSVVRLRHGEVLDEKGHLYVDNLRGARAIDTVVCDGRPLVWEPSFTMHGFRYVELTGDPAAIGDASVVGVAVSSVDVVDAFDCSSPQVGRLLQNIQRTLQSNLVEVPTDCPQRDERLGWLGDGQTFAPTAMLLSDSRTFYEKWLVDVLDAQRRDGSLTDTAPQLYEANAAAPGYGDAVVLLPWAIYRRHGDPQVLRRAYDGMRRWVDYVRRHNPRLVWERAQGTAWGEWLSLDPCSTNYLATAYFARTTATAALAAQALGEDDDAAYLALLADDIRTAFEQRFCDDDGVPLERCQSAQVLALAFDLLRPEARRASFDRLVEGIGEQGYSTTGILGVAFVLPTLSRGGRPDLALDLLERTTYPSWGYQLTQGATTIWERWNAVDPSGVMQDPEMNSFNQPVLGSIGRWLVESLGGVRRDAAGYRSVLLTPEVGSGLAHARATVEAPAGPVVCAWERGGDDVVVRADLPPATSGRLVLPRGAEVTSDHVATETDLPRVRLFEPVQVIDLQPGTHRVELHLG